MNNKGSDKNVANIEDDVKIVKEFIDYAQEVIDDMEYERPVDVTVYQKDLTSIKNILAEREQKDKQIQELEEEKAMLKRASNIAKEVNIEDVTDVINKSCKEFMSNYIPKQVIIDKIKENIEILNKTNDGNLRERLYLENGIMKELLGGESK